MFKIRMNPSVPVSASGTWPPLPAELAQRPIFFVLAQPQTVESILMTPEPWFEQDTGRLEYAEPHRSCGVTD